MDWNGRLNMIIHKGYHMNKKRTQTPRDVVFVRIRRKLAEKIKQAPMPAGITTFQGRVAYLLSKRMQ